ncbi:MULTISPECIES: YchJ family protein [Nitrincola]|uniref:YchJ-like middle NTF2-like domain-containing protein n=1 Tax=Nitrincola nitratireducens TaxID=1229521 RepID=W9VQN7_9GAMM|nr:MULTISPECIES: YchJ family metal-binding protein [Nitrincola]EXJ12760.1 hypothetical protein D791_00101 [Nitrincola nitratireducens]
MMQDQNNTEQACPCQSGKPFMMCCAPAINGYRPAKTAEALMRSRYTAFSIGAVDYLIHTTAPEKRQPEDQEVLNEQTQITVWTKLEILSTQQGKIGDSEGTVEFKASFETPEDSGTLHEISRFRFDDNQWFYVDGELNFIID